MFRRGLLPDVRGRGASEDWTPQIRRPGSMFDLFEDFMRTPFEFGQVGQMDYPALNISEDEKEIKVEAELPGMGAKDVDISMQNNNLVIQGEKKFEDEDKRDNYHRVERAYGSFYRSIPLPVKVDEDNIKASFKNGILNISLPKQEEAKGKKIQIES
ncbi:MAG: Hsp20/alpha crystallin family protein [Desulfohalobiaceae bacterium]